jgi:hypothetical protein
MVPPVLKNRRWSVSGGGRAVAGQPTAQRGADGVGQDGEHDVEVDVERDGAGEGVQAEGLDGFGEALFDVHPPGVGADDLAGGELGRLVISTVGWSWPRPVTASWRIGRG